MTLTIERSGKTTEIHVEAGERLIEALARAGVNVSAPCGGRCFCGKCLVKVAGEVSPVIEAERKFISGEKLEDGWRLACACHVQGDVRVFVEETLASVLVDGISGDIELDPPAYAREVLCEKPTLEAPVSDASRIAAALNIDPDDICGEALAMAPEALRGGDTAWCAMFRNSVRGVYGKKPVMLGCAVDIGTTTMAAYLVDLADGRQLASASMLNPQKAHGGDVITRANHTMENADGLRQLAALVRGGICDMIDDMCARAGMSGDDVRHIVLVGNTIMMHLAAELCVKYIATLPFVPVYTKARHVDAAQLDMPYKNATVTLGPCVAGYVGADTIAAALACGMDRPGENLLLLDVGTNGEIVLRTDRGLWCCAAAAGPAFEGAHIKCGSGAVTGAIDSVKISADKPEVTTIGGAAPVSICGSGIVSAVSEMLKAEIIDETGRLEEDFVLAGDVVICQKDVREVQLAKAAIAAGIGVLADAAGIDINDISRLCLAGGFGNYIDHDAACTIGLIPPELEGRIESVGNAAGSGAKMLMMNRDAMDRAEDLRNRMQYIELSASTDFQERFADNMLFE